jgi:nucleotide-binding universal stress UspA family protein
MANPYRRILFATDLSDLSLDAWPHAVELAQRLGAELLLATVIEEPYALADSGDYALLLQSLQEIRPQIERKLTEVAQRAPKSVTTHVAVLEARKVAHALIDHATRERCDLIVVATHGRGGLEHLLMGSVAERLLRISKVPVLVVPPARSAA